MVATQSDGPREILDAPGLGRLVPHGDAARLAEAITKSLAEPGDAAARIARAQDFSADKAVDCHARLFDAVSARGAPA